MKLNLLHWIFSQVGLKQLFVCCHSTLGLQEWSVGWDFFFGERQSRSQGPTAF